MVGNRIVFTATLGELAEVPGTPFAYWAPRSLRELFQKYPPLDRDVAGMPGKPKIADVKVGLQTSDDLRFTRFWWEVPVERIATSREETWHGKKWVPFAKGGRPFYHDIQVVVNWENDGEKIKNFDRAVVRNESFYFRPGLAWTKSAWIRDDPRLDVGLLPAGVIFTAKRMAVFIAGNIESQLNLCAFLHSLLSSVLINLINPSGRNREAGHLARLPIRTEVRNRTRLGELAREAHDLLREWATGDETATVFIAPWILQVWRWQTGKSCADLIPVTGHPLARDFAWSEWESAKQIRHALCEVQGDGILQPLAIACVRWEMRLRQRLGEVQQQIDDEVYRLYGISEEDCALIEAELGQSVEVEEEVEEEIEAGEEAEVEQVVAQIALLPAEEHIRRLVHYLAHETIKEDPDGIVPLYDTYTTVGELERGLPFRLRAKLQELFGVAAMPSVEQELRETLGKSLDEWLATDFFCYHTGLYRLRPIIWQIASRPRGVPAFGCFVYWHKLDTDTLRKVQEVYLRPVLEGAQREEERLATQYAQKRVEGVPLRELRQAERAWRQAEVRFEELRNLSERIQYLFQPQHLSLHSHSKWVVEKVNEVVAQGYRPNRDYGVRVNIEPLKQAGILGADAFRVKG